MKRWLLILALSTIAHAQLWNNILAPSRAIDWSGVGSPVMAAAASWPRCTTGTGTSVLPSSSTFAQINTAISGCDASHAVELGGGTFTLGGGIIFNVKNNVVLRGQGGNTTFLAFTTDVSCQGQFAVICFQSSDPNYQGGVSNSTNWTAGYAAGTASITLTAVPSLAVGDPIALDQTDDVSDNGAIFVCNTVGQGCVPSGQGNGGAPRSGRSQQQIVTVTSISGAGPFTVGITPAIRAPNWSGSKTPQAWWASNPIIGSGVENVSIQVPTNQYAIVTFFNCNGCWMKGVRSVGNPTPFDNSRSHVIVFQSNRISVVDNYFYKTDDTASVNYGVEPFPASDLLVQNNIFEQVQAPIPANGSCNGCVFAYNFDVNNVFTGGTFLNQGQFLHATDVDFVLSEGNIGAGFNADNFHGTHNLFTLYRNYYNGYQKNEGNFTTSATTPITLQSHTRFGNVLGNVLGNCARQTIYESAVGNVHAGSVIYALGFGNGIPDDANTPLTLMRWGNYDCVTNTNRFVNAEVPSGLTGTQAPFANSVPASQTLPASFYLASKPAFFGPKVWPPIGPDVSGGDVKYCVGGAQTGTYVLTSGQCPGGTATTLAGGRINSNPAMDCYLNIMNGPPDGQGAVLPFDASLCPASGLAPAVTLAPSSLTFSALLVGLTSASQPLTLTNTGTATLTISSIVASGDFAQSNDCGATLAISAFCTITVTFSPTDQGVRAGAITVTDNASGSPHSAVLSGTGIAPTIYRPTTFTDSGVNPVVNPTFAYDADLTTFATGTADDPAGTAHPYTIVYSGFPATIGTPLYAAIYLYNASYNLGCSLGGEQAEYSLDGGATWNQAWVGRTHGAQNAPLLDRVILSPGQQFSQVQVRFGFLSGGTPTGCSLVTQMYEVWIQIGAPTSTFQGGNLFPGGNVLQ